MENEAKNKKIFWLAGLTVILVLTGLYLFFMFKNNFNKNEMAVETENFTVLGVPYFGIYNHKGSLSGLGGYSGGDYTCAAVLEVLEYWNPGQNDFRAVCDDLSRGVFTANQDNFSPIPSDNFAQVFSQNNLAVENVKLSVSDLGKYINPEMKTPLIALFLPITSDQPNSIEYAIPSVLIGINEKEQKLTFHNYWLGNNYEISYDEFNQLENKLPENQRNSYIVVQPKNLDEKLQEIAKRKIENYPTRTEVMQKGEQMFKDYAVGSGAAFRGGLWPPALEYLSKVEDSPNFNDFFPPYFKTMLYYQKAKLFFFKNDLDNALMYAQKAVAGNNDLNQSFKDWPGYEVSYVSPATRGIAPEPYLVLGDILDKNGDLKGALEAYKKASSLMLYSKQVNADIQNVELEMAQKGLTE